MTEEPKVCVLIATYNGANYLAEQLESIADQTYKNIALLVSDDGSTDDTLAILEEYKKKIDIKVVNNTNTHGAFANFFNAMRNAPKADFYAFSDHDDVWNKDKIQKMVDVIKNEKEPALVYSDSEIVDENLQPNGQTFVRMNNYYLKPGSELKQLLVSNYIQGCAMLFNKALFDKLDKYPNPSFAHDWWVAVSSALLGKIFFINEPLHKYRQHSNNAVGKGKSALAKLGNITVLKKQWQKDNKLSLMQAKKLVELYPKNDRIEIVKQYIDIFNNQKGFKRKRAMTSAGFNTIKKVSMNRFLLG